MNKNKEVYFLVEKYTLSTYGDGEGSDKERTLEILESLEDEDLEELIVIKGVIIEPFVKRTFDLE